jgi:3-oxoacyl-[acyl-carrier protein] reductase
MSPPSWSEQTALVTGGASGLGFAIAERLAGLGVAAALLDLDSDGLDSAVAKLGGKAFAVPTDVTDAPAVERAVAGVVARTGRLDILVNSAGITGRTGIKSHEVDPADFERVFRVNVHGCFHTSRAALPHMLARSYGRILHIASIAGKEGNAGMLAYSASKAAVIGLTKVQGKEYAETGITVNALAPAVVRTPMVAAMPAAQVTYMTDKIPMKRCCELSEVAALASVIVSPETSFTTAFTWDLTGGRAVY